jgi:non-haem dioxygenase in morphine synthesis N-terminal
VSVNEKGSVLTDVPVDDSRFKTNHPEVRRDWDRRREKGVLGNSTILVLRFIIGLEKGYGASFGIMGENPHSSTIPISIPVIDFAAWSHKASREERHAISTELVKACAGVGFAYIINHGVPQDALDQAFAISKQLYDLPQEEKMKAPHPPGWAHHRGYSWPGLEKVSAAQSKDDNQALVDELRRTVDCKVNHLNTMLLIMADP